MANETNKPNAPKVKSSGGSRYIGIVLPMILIIVVVALVFYVMYTTNAANRKLNDIRALSDTQAVSVQNLKNIVYNLDIYSRSLQDLDEDEQEDVLEEVQIEGQNLSVVQDVVSTSLHLLKNGGHAKIGDIDYSITKLEIPEIVRDVTAADDIWTNYNRLLNSLSDEIKNGKLEVETSDYVVQYAREYNEELANSLKDVNTYISKQISKNDAISQQAQIIGAILVAIIFLYMIFVALAKLSKADNQLEQARKEMSDIMSSVQEGLFLVSPDLQIGHEFSKALTTILPIRNIGGRQFDEVVEPLVNATDLTNTRRFIKQLFNKNVKQDLVDDLNPLRKISIAIENENGMFEERFLNFHFSRVLENKQITHVLGSVRDITESVLLQQQLEEERSQNAAYTEMLMKVLMIDPNLLDSFTSNTSKIVTRINETLRKPDTSQAALREKVDVIFREVHSFKGEASALEFDSFVKVAEDAEEKLKSLRSKTKLSGDDFLGVAISLDSIINVNRQLVQIKDKLAEFSSQRVSQSSETDTVSLIIKQLESFSSQIAERNGKSVQFIAEGWETADLNRNMLNTLKEISIQLLRNAIVHGIETPAEREAQQKPAVGQIKSSLIHTGDQYELRLEDDGRGIDLDLLRAKLKTLPKYEGVDVDSLSKQELYRSIFMSGFSTAEKASEDAGRGEGMGIVKDRIRNLPSGKIAISSLPGQFTRFVVRFNKSDI